MKKTSALLVLLFCLFGLIKTNNVDAATKSCTLNLKKWSSCENIVISKTKNALIYDYGTSRPADDASITGWAYTYGTTKRILSLSGYIEVSNKRVSLSLSKSNAVNTYIKQTATLTGYDFATKHSGLTSRASTDYAVFK